MYVTSPFETKIWETDEVKNEKNICTKKRHLKVEIRNKTDHAFEVNIQLIANMI